MKVSLYKVICEKNNTPVLQPLFRDVWFEFINDLTSALDKAIKANLGNDTHGTNRYIICINDEDIYFSVGSTIFPHFPFHYRARFSDTRMIKKL